MAISLPFSVTIRSSVQTMQKLATMMASERMMNVAIFSSLSALKRFLLISSQSRTRSSRPWCRRRLAADRRVERRPRARRRFSGSGTRTSMLVM